MRNDVGERDWDQRVGKATTQLRRRRLAGAGAVHSDDGEPVEPAYHPHKQQQAHGIGEFDRSTGGKAKRSKEIAELLRHPARSSPGRSLRETVEASGADQHTDDSDRTRDLWHLERTN